MPLPSPGRYFTQSLASLMALAALFGGQRSWAQSIVIEPATLVLEGVPGGTLTGLITIRNNKPAQVGNPDFNKLLLTFNFDDVYDWEDWQRYFTAKRNDAVQAGELYDYNQSLPFWNPADIRENVKRATYNPTLRAGESLTMLVMVGPFPDLDEAGVQEYNYVPSFSPEDYSIILNKTPIRVEISHPAPLSFKDAGFAALLNQELASFYASSSNADLPFSFSSGEPIRPYHLFYLEGLYNFNYAGPDIQQLDGLEHAVNLTILSLPNENISSIEPLRGLKRLERVFLFNNQISDISPLEGLVDVQFLNVSGNWIDTTAGSPGRTQLDAMRARQVNVTDTPQRAGMRGISNWASQIGLPEDKLEPESINGPLQLPNVLAFAMGLDPLNPDSAELPSAGRAEDAATTGFVFRYKRDLKVLGVRTAIEATADLQTWTIVVPDRLEVVSDNGNGVQVVEAIFNDPDMDKRFFRLKVLSNN